METTGWSKRWGRKTAFRACRADLKTYGRLFLKYPLCGLSALLYPLDVSPLQTIIFFAWIDRRAVTIRLTYYLNNAKHCTTFNYHEHVRKITSFMQDYGNGGWWLQKACMRFHTAKDSKDCSRNFRLLIRGLCHYYVNFESALFFIEISILTTYFSHFRVVNSLFFVFFGV